MVDALPSGPPFHVRYISVVGDIKEENGQFQKEELELWYRDPVELVRELLGNPAFAKYTTYEPYKVYKDMDKTNRCFGEMWTGDWWWDTQVCNFLSG
jgi:hypothetical protein